MDEKEELGVYDGIRGQPFSELIKHILNDTLPEEEHKKISIVSKPKYIGFFNTAFNDVSYDSNNNNYAMSILGNQTFEKSLLWHFRNKFPMINGDILFKIKNKLVETRSVAKYIDEIYNVWDYISISNNQREYIKNNPDKSHIKFDIIQKVFDAFCASIEIILDSIYPIGVGFAFVNKMIVYILNHMKISYKHEDIYDRVGILNDLKQTIKNTLHGEIIYEDQELISPLGDRTYKVEAYFSSRGYKTKIGEGVSILKGDAKEISAKQAFLYIQSRGVYYHIPEIFKTLEKL